jgi:membrane protein required for colicin V production
VNPFDVGLCILAAAFVLYGLLRGLVRIVVSIVSLFAAFVVASLWHEPLAAQWEAPRIAAWAVLFVAVVLTGGVLAWLASRLLAAASLSWLDRLAGGAVGAVAALVAGAVLAVPLAAYGGADAQLLRTSRLAPYVTAVSDWVNIASPDALARRYERASAALKRTWRDRG